MKGNPNEPKVRKMNNMNKAHEMKEIVKSVHKDREIFDPDVTNEYNLLIAKILRYAKEGYSSTTYSIIANFDFNWRYVIFRDKLIKKLKDDNFVVELRNSHIHIMWE